MQVSYLSEAFIGQLTFGILQDIGLCKYLLSTDELTFETASNLAQQFEAVERDTSGLSFPIGTVSQKL